MWKICLCYVSWTLNAIWTPHTILHRTHYRSHLIVPDQNRRHLLHHPNQTPLVFSLYVSPIPLGFSILNTSY